MRSKQIATCFLAFIVLYILYLVLGYIIPNGYEISIIILLGFAIIIAVILYFILKIDSPNNILIRVKILDENTIKMLLIILMILTFFIPAVSFSDVIINWKEIHLLNYIRGGVFLIGALFIPGACIFNLIFPNSTLHERLNVEPFLVKITIYPIISLTYLGSLTLILDFLGFNRSLIIFILFFSIILLYAFSVFFQKFNKYEVKKKEINISRYTILILFIGLGIVIVSFGILLKSQYLIAGDRWRAIAFATRIGVPDIATFELADTYTKYWGCVSFSLSVLCGIPYINTNVLLFLFSYLSIASIYLFIKALLNKMSEKYCILSSIFIAIFFQPMMLIVQFSFHSFAFFTLFLSLTLIFIVIKSGPLENRKNLNTENKVLIALSALFLVQSLITYSIPALMGILAIFLYSLLLSNKKQDLRVLLVFYGYFIVFFISIDLLALNFFSFWIIQNLSYFLGISLHNLYRAENINLLTRLFNSIRLYAFLIAFLISLIFIYDSKKITFKMKKITVKINKIIKKKYKQFIVMFFLIGLILASLDFTFIYRLLLGGRLWWGGNENSQVYFLIFYFSIFFAAIGLFGILGMCLSYFCFNENKKLFYFLLSWIVLTLGLASSLIFIRWAQYPMSLVYEIPGGYYVKLYHWFTRTWYYSMIPLSIFTSIGLIKLIQRIKVQGWFKRNKYKRKKSTSSITLIYLLIFLSLSNPISQVIFWDNYYSVPHEDAQFIGWITKNVPRESKILFDSYMWNFNNRLEGDLYLYKTFYLESELGICQGNLSDVDIIQIIDYLKIKNIDYLILNKQHVCDGYQKLIIQYYNTSDSKFPYSYGNYFIYKSNSY